jgi:hypothetical protein
MEFFNLLPYFLFIGNWSLFALLMIMETAERIREEKAENTESEAVKCGLK